MNTNIFYVAGAVSVIYTLVRFLEMRFIKFSSTEFPFFILIFFSFSNFPLHSKFKADNSLQKIKNSLEDLNYHCEDMSVLGVFKADKLRKK